MAWLGLDYDEGPFYQMQRLGRYHEVAEQLLNSGDAYYCYCTREELDAMREQQRAAGLKPRYDGRWRDSKETPPAGMKPVVRLKNPLDGVVAFNDLVKGEIIVANSELDDLVLLRADGVPTYNFGVVIDDLDMNITHVIRGDDHVNNTPRQINILQALRAPIPAICACTDDPGGGWREAFKAPRRCFSYAVSRRWLSARGTDQLSGAAWLVAWR